MSSVSIAREKMEVAISHLEVAHRTWGECVSALHMAELQLKLSQKNMRQAYEVLCGTLNGER